MIRTRTLIGPLVVAVALIVFGIHRVAASPAPESTVQTTMTPVVEINNAAKTWHIAGTIQMMNGEFWDVQGFVIQVTGTTKITGDLPSIGTSVDATGNVQPDGTWLATSVSVGQTVPMAESPTSSPTSTPPSTSTPVPTATATPVATATATALATVTASPVATASAEDREADSGQTSSASPGRNPLGSRPVVTVIQNLLPLKNSGATDKGKNPHPVHPPHPQSHKQNSENGHGQGHGHGD
ncbi:MAG TPA: DUF5666 domain-containing protein [Chloroflexota bacterium]|nr:DUF5666 domain-containing protein [Chloroflexota bacterium]